MLFVDRAHQRRSRRKDLVDEDEDGLLRRELDSLPDDVDELANSEILKCIWISLRQGRRRVDRRGRLTHGTRYFFLSMVAMSDFSSFSQMTWSEVSACAANEML